jgi:hypothetical protein
MPDYWFEGKEGDEIPLHRVDDEVWVAQGLVPDAQKFSFLFQMICLWGMAAAQYHKKVTGITVTVVTKEMFDTFAEVTLVPDDESPTDIKIASNVFNKYRFCIRW